MGALFRRKIVRIPNFVYLRLFIYGPLFQSKMEPTSKREISYFQTNEEDKAHFHKSFLSVRIIANGWPSRKAQNSVLGMVFLL